MRRAVKLDFTPEPLKKLINGQEVTKMLIRFANSVEREMNRVARDADQRGASQEAVQRQWMGL